MKRKEKVAVLFLSVWLREKGWTLDTPKVQSLCLETARKFKIDTRRALRIVSSLVHNRLESILEDEKELNAIYDHVKNWHIARSYAKGYLTRRLVGYWASKLKISFNEALELTETALIEAIRQEFKRKAKTVLS